MALMTPVSRILSISALVTLAFVYSSITSGSRHLSVGLNVSGKEGSRIKSQAGRAKTTPAAFLPPRMPRPSGMPRRQYLRNLGAATLSIAGILRGRDKANAIGTSKDFTVPVEILNYEEMPCPEGSSTRMRCVKVTANLNNPAPKTAKSVSLFGFVTYSEMDTDALWSEESNYCGTVDTLEPGDNTVTFVTQLRRYKGFTGGEAVSFRKVRARIKIS
ncbi:hypothetical protein AAMO2058_000943100 [Amorphochlora amoebiformis]